MARERDPKRDLAFEMYKEHNGEILIKDIADKLGKGEGTVRGWKTKDEWDFLLFGTKRNGTERSAPKPKERSNNTEQSGTETSKSTVNKKKKKDSGTKGSKKKKPRSGNPNPSQKFPKRNTFGLKHGMRSKYIPQETQDLMDQLETMSPADLVWEQIKFQYASIVRAQRIMFVEDENDTTKVLKRVKLAEPESAGEETSDDSLAIEKEYELQFAWDKHAKFLAAQSRALSELRSLIRQFLEMSSEEDERRMKLKQMSLNIEKSKLEIKRLESANDESQQENTETKLEKYFENLQEAFVDKNEDEE